MTEEEQNRLIERIVRGDADALRAFIESNKRLVYSLVFRLVPNAADHEDLCQDVFISAYQNLKDFRRESKVSTWLAKITWFRCINHLKKKKPELFEDGSPEETTLDDLAGEFMDPSMVVEQKETAELLHRSIELLPPVYRAVLTLYHIEGQSYAEIGEALSLPEGTVKSCLFRARRLLRRQLSPLLQEDMG